MEFYSQVNFSIKMFLLHCLCEIRFWGWKKIIKFSTQKGSFEPNKYCKNCIRLFTKQLRPILIDNRPILMHLRTTIGKSRLILMHLRTTIGKSRLTLMHLRLIALKSTL